MNRDIGEDRTKTNRGRDEEQEQNRTANGTGMTRLKIIKFKRNYHNYFNNTKFTYVFSGKSILFIIMSRPGAWRTVWNEFWGSFARGSSGPTRRYIGEDQHGNKYYELERTRRASNIKRGFEAAPNAPPPPVEWEGWLKSARRFPPSDEEIRLNMVRQQAQLKEGAETEKRAPTIQSRGVGAADMDRKQQKGFPTYQEEHYEQNPAQFSLLFVNRLGQFRSLPIFLSLIIINAKAPFPMDYVISPKMHESIKRIFDGILLFRKTLRPSMVKEFERVRDHPDPRAVLFTCMDSRLQPSKFMQARIGDLFVVRNSANMIPVARDFGDTGSEVSVTTEPAALELAIKRGNVCQVFVCGHSDCKAINTLYQLYHGDRTFDPKSPMDHWLRKNGYPSVQKLEELERNGPNSRLEFASENGLMKFGAKIDPEGRLGVEDRLSQINTLQQLTNTASHEFLREYIEQKQVGLQAIWLDIFGGELYFFSRQLEQFVPIREDNADSLMQEALQN